MDMDIGIALGVNMEMSKDMYWDTDKGRAWTGAWTWT
jgi:hypothetical protein